MKEGKKALIVFAEAGASGRIPNKMNMYSATPFGPPLHVREYCTEIAFSNTNSDFLLTVAQFDVRFTVASFSALFSLVLLYCYRV